MAMDKTFDAGTAEPAIREKWEEARAFAMGAGAEPGAEPFSILLPPPNVTGSLHMGHAFNHTLMDILARWRRMQGRDTLWQPGLDHAGIATQMVVERQLAVEGAPGRRDMGRAAFIDKVWEWKEQSGGTILEQCARLGDSFDLSRNRFTMDEGFHRAVLEAFVTLYEKKLIYRGKRLVNWDPKFETAISDLEVENIETPGHMWHFKYPLAGGESYEYVEKNEDGNVILRETRDYISIATTRPETMLGDGAVAVHPDDERYAPIVGKLCEIPVGPKAHRRQIPIITDDYPDPDFGSGAVKITGAHDFNDYGVATRNGIPLYALMDTRGHMRADGLSYEDSAAIATRAAAGEDVGDVTEVNLVPEDLRGLDRFEARKRVVAAITQEGLAVMEHGAPLVEDKMIMQPFGDRSKVVIEPMLTDQWFVDAGKLAGPALEAVRSGMTRIYPESQEKTYYRWLENIEPWCISRQLWWGHQIPVWYGFDLRLTIDVDDEHDGALDEVEILKFLTADRLVRGSDRAHCAVDFDAVSRQFDDVIAGLPTPLSHARVIEAEDRHDAAHKLAASLADYAVSQDPTHLVYPVWRDPDVLDTWFSSGIWPIGTFGWPEQTPELRRYHPTSVLVTGFDILFFWVARMMMMQIELHGQVPFRDVYIHALVRDEHGKKMSKSLGNILDPLELIDEYGADAVRFTLSSMAAMGRDVKLSRDRIAGYRNFGTKLWNAARFAEMNQCVPDPAFDPAGVTLTPNRWIVGETGRVRETLDAALDAYRFNEAAGALYAFVWGKVCDWYVEFAKPLFSDEAAAPETRATMAWVLDQCVTLLHPFMPFITEALWGQHDRRTVLALADWPDFGLGLLDHDADDAMNWLIALIEEIRSVRAQMRVPAGAKVDLIALDLSPKRAALLKSNEPLVARLARVETFGAAEVAPKGAVTLAVEGATFCLPLADVIDVDAERARLEKSRAKLEKSADAARRKLDNPQFLQKAEPAVVEKAREDLAAQEEEIAILEAAEARLAELS